MGGLQPGDKLTAANLNGAYMCTTDDTGSTGRIETEKYFVVGKRDEQSSSSQTLVADVGVINLTSAELIIAGDATTLSPDATLGNQDGQEITIINSTGADYTLNFVSPAIELDDGQAVKLVYCATQGGWVSTSAAAASKNLICEITGSAPGSVGDLVYNNAGVWTLADHSVIGSVATHMVVGTDATGYSIQAIGPVIISGHGFTVGETYYGDIGTVGAASTVEPSNAGEIVQPVFTVIDANKLELLISNEPTVLTAANSTTNPVHVEAGRLFATSTVASGSSLVIPFNSNVVSVGGGYNPSTGEFTAPVSGIYSIAASAMMRVPSTLGIAETGRLIIDVNSSSQVVGTQSGNSTGSSNILHVASPQVLAAGDVVTIRFLNLDSGTRDIGSANTELRIARVGDA